MNNLWLIMRVMKIGCLLLIIVALTASSAYPQSDNLPAKFRAETDLARKEQLLYDLMRQPGAGPTLLLIAKHADDVLTRWMSIRGIGMVKYDEAVPFLIDSLTYEHPYVRGNAARALGEIRARSASSILVRLLEHEKDGGVIEQTSLALQMLGAKEAVPSLKKVAPHPSSQTRCWVLQAIGTLGGKKDVPFLAEYLYDPSSLVDMCAARAVTEITGEDFGFPKQSGLMNPQEGIGRARRWWEKSKASFQDPE